MSVSYAFLIRVQKQEEHPHRMPLAGLIFGRIACGRAFILFLRILLSCQAIPFAGFPTNRFQE